MKARGAGAQENDHPHERGLGLALCSWCGGCTLTCSNGGYGFTSISWRQQGCRPRRRERGRERESTNVAERKRSYLQDIMISGICHYSAHLWKDRFGDENLQRKMREIDQSDKGKWCLRQKKTIKIKKNK